MASQEKSMPFIKNLASSGPSRHPLPLHQLTPPPHQERKRRRRGETSRPTNRTIFKDRKTRTAALTSLRTFLSAKHISTSLTTLDILKLWKGLFYAMWMCDRPLPQQQLCNDLSELVWALPDDCAVVAPWLRGFWATMAREWTTGIDVLRMEKFLLLVRRVLGASLAWMQARQQPAAASKKTKRTTRAGKKRGADGEDKSAAEEKKDVRRWDRERVGAVLTLLADWPFRADEESRHEEEEDALMPKLVPTGLKLHVLDIWVDEAEKAGLLEGDCEDDKKEEEEEEEEEEDTLPGRKVIQRINELVDKLREQTLSKAVRIRSKESLADERLPWNKKEAGGEEGGEDGEWGGLDD